MAARHTSSGALTVVVVPPFVAAGSRPAKGIWGNDGFAISIGADGHGLIGSAGCPPVTLDGSCNLDWKVTAVQRGQQIRLAVDSVEYQPFDGPGDRLPPVPEDFWGHREVRDMLSWGRPGDYVLMSPGAGAGRWQAATYLKSGARDSRLVLCAGGPCPPP